MSQETTEAQLNTDIKIAFAALRVKKVVYDILWNYYDGDHNLKYSSERLQEVFGTTLAKFIENWCAVIIDTTWERLVLKGFEIGTNAEAKARLEVLWKRSQLDLDAFDVHLSTLITGEAFVIVWPDSNNEIQAYYNDSRLCHVRYDQENPRKMKWAAKWWVDDSRRYHLNLYYVDRIEYYITDSMKQAPSSAAAFKPADPPDALNPYGMIPVFHFRRQRRIVSSELSLSILSLQDAVNKILTDLMVTAEFGAFPQRYIISNADAGDLKNAPNEIWEIPSGDGVGQAASVGQLAAASLENYTKSIEHMVRAISAISRTPQHFFFGAAGQISGEALIALEAPLNKKCRRYMGTLGDTWQRATSFMLMLDNRAVPPEDITTIWTPPETVQPRTSAEIRKMNVEAGIPLTTTLRGEGWTNSDLEQLEKDRAQEKASASASLAVALVEQQRGFDQPTEVGQEIDTPDGGDDDS